MDELMEETITRIRSCLISVKGRITLKQLVADYRMLLGENIPYKRLGFNTLQDFLSSIPSIELTRTADGDHLIDAKITPQTAHLAKMINRQKSNNTKRTNATTNRPKKSGPIKSAHWRPHNIAPPRSRPQSIPYVNQIVRNTKAPHKPKRNVHRRTPPPPSPPPDIDCPPLKSTKKRLSQLMKEISLDGRDSGNCSPSPEFLANESKKLVFDNVMDELKHFTTTNQLGDVVVTMKDLKLKQRMVVCKIKIGDKYCYSSYPKEFDEEKKAEEYAARCALDDLLKKYPATDGVTIVSHRDDVKERISTYLMKHITAIWSWQIIADYIDLYGEQLPNDWLEIVDECPNLSVQECMGDVALRYFKPGEMAHKDQNWAARMRLQDVSIPSKCIEFNADEDRLDACITALVSVNAIWCQQIGTESHAIYRRNMERMNVYYTKHADALRVNNVSIGGYYVVYRDTIYQRAKCLEKDSDTEKRIRFTLIDEGLDCHINMGDIYKLRREFAVDDAQAFVLRLDGLEDLDEMSQQSMHLYSLIGECVLLEFASRQLDNDTVLPVVMYDKDGNSINQKLIESITSELATPTLNKNIVNNAYVTYIDSNGDIYIQLRTPGTCDRLETMIADLVETLQSRRNGVMSTLNTSGDGGSGDTWRHRLFLVPYGNRWRRARALDRSPDARLVQIFYIDYGGGNVIEAETAFAYPLSLLSDVIASYPAQALRVRPSIEFLPANFVEEASRLIAADEMMIIRVVGHDMDGVARVDLFKRSNGALLCVNQAIAIEAELRNEKKKKKENELKIGLFDEALSNSVPSGGRLKKPNLPKKEERYFGIHVPFAVNPWNFFVQPNESYSGLTKLMVRLQEVYSNTKHMELLKLNDAQPGTICASKYTDGHWYRTSILKVINPKSISVCYCDFGYYTNLKLDQLYVLDTEFMALPYQALKAKLAGIKPKNNKWTVEDCEIFNRLVLKKRFVSSVIEIANDELCPSDVVLKLILFDTSTEQDRNINDELIRKGLAVKE